jgi:hypothetical protein
MPWFVFDVKQGCGCKEAFQCRVDLADLPYDAVPRLAFDEVKQQFRKRRCARCEARLRPAPGRQPRRGRTTRRRNVRAGDTDGFDPDRHYPDGYDPDRLDTALGPDGYDDPGGL